MSSAGSSSQRPVFTKPYHFSRAWGEDGWICNMCTPEGITEIPTMTPQAAMEHERTREHRKREEELYRQQLQDASGGPGGRGLTLEGLKLKEQPWHIDHARDIVPWWVKSTEAAKRGEEWKMEELLERISHDPWAEESRGELYNNGWGGDVANENDWADGRNGWGESSEWRQGAPSGWSRAQVPRDWVIGRSVSGSVDAPRTTTATSADRNRKRKEKILERIRKSTGTLGTIRTDLYRFVEDIANREAVGDERKRKLHMFLEMSTQEKVEKINEIIQHLHAIEVGSR